MRVLIEFNVDNKKHKKELIEFLEDIFNDYPLNMDNKEPHFKVIENYKTIKEKEEE